MDGLPIVGSRSGYGVSGIVKAEITARERAGGGFTSLPVFHCRRRADLETWSGAEWDETHEHQAVFELDIGVDSAWHSG